MSDGTDAQAGRFRRTLRWFDDRVGGAPAGRRALRKVFPGHWSFLIGEVALYSFVILVVTGVFLTFFFEPSTREVTYDGPYAPLRGQEMSAAYRSALELSFEVRAGLVMRQVHHWAALVFLASIVLHLARVFFTGAFRRPREVNWMIGVTLLVLAIANGFFGYSLLDDLLSGTGLRVAWSIALATPVLGPDLAFGLFGGEFPSASTIPRFFSLHVLVIPVVIGALLALHLGLLWRQKHTQFRGPGRTEDNVVGHRLWPGFLLRSTALFLMTGAVLTALGGLAQINPIWVYGPFSSTLTATAATSASQPDWYMGWLDGALRIFPGWETRAFGFTIPNAFYPGVLLPTVTFGLLYAWPFIEARITHDRRSHHLLDRPRDAPWRTGLGAAVLSFYGLLFLAGSNDVLSGLIGVAPETLTNAFRVGVFVVPAGTFLLVRTLCDDLRRSGVHPGTGLRVEEITRGEHGELLERPASEAGAAAREAETGAAAREAETGAAAREAETGAAAREAGTGAAGPEVTDPDADRSPSREPSP
ncbi:cytochrome bc1 complex cytochrome b subunit [Dermatobacter hominis]|uniref:cytochrome bc1 complex cytochrome b subunit n=1 Tax=Dermatobacter hominis TaxID=2884263 RepID=UPI001D116307|nr:ubiquinol-cytochrome c reductase cytochrome b subunit [Dermatobacter hominis]UDY34161.1 ubiquinol-cytochrome c reductase cytochrome b subunit [Dermatobacter hominis]